jgi:hypothetical protein
MEHAEARKYFEDSPSFDERVARSEIEQEIRKEYDLALRQRRDEERDRRILALGISAALTLAVVVPLLAAVFGFSWRVLSWAAGWGW